MSQQINPNTPPPVPPEEHDTNQPSIAPPSVLKKIKFGGGDNSGLMGKILISLVVTVVVLFLASAAGGVFFAPLSKYNDLAKNLNGITADKVNGIEKNVNSTLEVTKKTISDDYTTKINQALQALAKVPTQSAVDSASSIASTAKTTAEKAQSGVDALITTTNNMKVDTSNAKSIAENAKTTAEQTKNDLATLKTQLDSLTTKVNAIPTPTASPTSSGSNTGNITVDKIAITVDDTYGLEMASSSYNFADSTESIKLKVINGNSYDVTDLTLYIYLIADDDIYPSWVASKSLTGGINCTSVASGDNTEFKFRTSRISVSAGKTKTYYLTPSLLMKPQYPYLVCSTYRINADPTTDVPYVGTLGSYNIGATLWYYATALPTDIMTTYYKVIDGSNPSTTYGCESKLQNDVSFDLTFDVIDYNLN